MDNGTRSSYPACTAKQHREIANISCHWAQHAHGRQPSVPSIRGYPAIARAKAKDVVPTCRIAQAARVVKRRAAFVMPGLPLHRRCCLPPSETDHKRSSSDALSLPHVSPMIKPGFPGAEVRCESRVWVWHLSALSWSRL